MIERNTHVIIFLAILPSPVWLEAVEISHMQMFTVT